MDGVQRIMESNRRRLSMTKKLNTAPRHFVLSTLEEIGSRRSSKFLIEVESPFSTMDFTLPMAVFYSKEAHPQGSNFMGLTYKPLMDHHVVLDALPYLPETVTGSQFSDGLYYHSTHRHDYFSDPDEPSRMIDGGQSYTRTGNPIDLHEFNIQDLVHEL